MLNGLLWLAKVDVPGQGCRRQHHRRGPDAEPRRQASAGVGVQLQELTGRAPADAHAGKRLAGSCHQRQRNSFSASVKQTPATRQASPAVGRAGRGVAPCSMCARSASITAVSGSALIIGCTASGKRCAEKNTPDSTHIGTCTRFIRFDTASIVRARLAISRPSALNDSDDEHADNRQVDQPAADRHAEHQRSEPDRQADLDPQDDHPPHQVRRQILHARHRGRHQPLGQLAAARVDNREADAPDGVAHDAEPDQPGHQEIDIARAGFAHQRRQSRRPDRCARPPAASRRRRAVRAARPSGFVSS